MQVGRVQRRCDFRDGIEKNSVSRFGNPMVLDQEVHAIAAEDFGANRASQIPCGSAHRGVLIDCAEVRHDRPTYLSTVTFGLSCVWSSFRSWCCSAYRG